MEECIINFINLVIENFNTIMYLILITYIVRLKFTCNKQDNCEHFCEKIAQRDYRYTVFILGSMIVLLSTSKFAETDKLLNYISFASTISSLILSVIAIFMSINSESKMDVVKSSLDTSLGKLSDFSQKLDDQISKFNELIANSKEHLDIYNNEMNIREEKLESTLKLLEERVDTMSKMIQDFNKNSNVENINNKRNIFNNKEDKKIEKIISREE